MHLQKQIRFCTALNPRREIAHSKQPDRTEQNTQTLLLKMYSSHQYNMMLQTNEDL